MSSICHTSGISVFYTSGTMNNCYAILYCSDLLNCAISYSHITDTECFVEK